MQEYNTKKRMEKKTASEEFAERLAEILVMQVELENNKKIESEK